LLLRPDDIGPSWKFHWQYFYYVSYHLFKQSRVIVDPEPDRRLQHSGAKGDWESIDQRPDKVEGKAGGYLPEGTWLSPNDRVGPLQEGFRIDCRLAAQ